ncbi:hypothetical protein [Paraburkholderia sp. BL21I4N1]|uniref:hypothetical protein n=1 Tax=Paraburkholderia sp. BL21I4N1 TaxID=1938801 RepID=UPI000CFCB26F|nr:hypothetical protein [Paraburkholderia sp. BL21I4N1]PQV53322.1 hypothetical protein B0G83_102408 [Paraburkholderia sp. BL21I4N1]HDR9217496.1 hypothetical protein [Burkholderia vietnamiensis]
MHPLTVPFYIAHPLLTCLFQALVLLASVPIVLGGAYLGFVLGARRHASHALPIELDHEVQATWIRPARPAFTQAEAGARLRAKIAAFNANRSGKLA